MRFKQQIRLVLGLMFFILGVPLEVHAESTTITAPIYHVHTGSAGGGGGCYGGVQTKTETIEIPCTGTLVYFPGADKTQCSGCGAGYYGHVTGPCPHGETETRTYTEYYLTCGKGNRQVGSLSLEKSPLDWTTEVILTGTYENMDMHLADAPYRWNGGSGSEQNTYTAIENGTYTLQLLADGNANTGAAILSTEIHNIDRTPPQIDGFVLSNEEWTKEDITITIVNPRDLQPDGTNGCGLPETPFSFDGGQSFQADPVATISASDTYSIQILDTLGNVFQIHKQITNIDKDGPTFTQISFDEEENLRENTIHFVAEDLQPDGSTGIGLADLPYSLDGGKTWIDDTELTVYKNGTYEILAKDKLDNVTSVEISITNIDTLGPTVSYVVEPQFWSTGPVKITFLVEDLQENGRPGVGLPKHFISYDEGKTWTNVAETTRIDNQIIPVWCRDIYGNITVYYGEIRYIDNNTPWMEVTADKDQLAVGETTFLRVNAYDAESGLAEEPYSFDGGKTWTANPIWKVIEPGTYLVMVRDLVDLIEYRYITISPLTIAKPQNKIKVKKVEQHPIFQPIAKIEQQKRPSTFPTLEKKEQNSNVSTRPEKEVAKLWNWKLFLRVLLGLCLLLLGFFLFLWILLHKTIRVYGYQGEEKYEYLGRRWIGKRDALYVVNITKFMIEKTHTTCFKLIPSKVFVKRNEEKQLEICFANEQAVSVQIDEEMIVENYIAT